MPDASKSVDGYIRKHKHWSEALTELRRIALSCGLDEAVKWRQPTYTLDGANVVMLGVFKDCCALSFLKGALLADKKKLLIAPGENTQSARWIKFTSADEVKKLEATAKRYIKEAIAAEKAGLKVEFKPLKDYDVPEELTAALGADATLRKAWDALTPGRRKEYILHFAGAKQSKTRTARIGKYRPTILAGKGMRDDYMQSRKSK